MILMVLLAIWLTAWALLTHVPAECVDDALLGGFVFGVLSCAAVVWAWHHEEKEDE